MADEWMRTSSLSRLATDQAAGARQLDGAPILARSLCSLLYLWSCGRPASLAPAQSDVSLRDLMTMARHTSKALTKTPSQATQISRYRIDAPRSRCVTRLHLREETGVG